MYDLKTLQRQVADQQKKIATLRDRLAREERAIETAKTAAKATSAEIKAATAEFVALRDREQAASRAAKTRVDFDKYHGSSLIQLVESTMNSEEREAGRRYADALAAASR